MKDSSSKKASAFIQSDSKDLEFIFTKVKRLEELNRKLSACLDAGIAQYCQAANLAGNKLTIIVANGSIATQIRFQSNDLIRKLKQDPDLRLLQQIDCKVCPLPTQAQLPQRNSRPKKMQRLSAETAAMMRVIAETLDDPRLKAVMERIASHTKK